MAITSYDLFGLRRPTTISSSTSDNVSSRLESFFLWCAGAIPEIVALPEVSVDRTKLLAIGQAAFVTACLAAVSMSQALRYLSDDPRIVFLGAVGYGTFITSVDRLFMVGLTGVAGLRNKLKVGVARVLIAAVASCVVSLCLELKIWEPEINAQLAINDAKSRRLAESNAGSADIPELEGRRATLLAEIRENARQADNANLAAIAEREGLEGTGKVGFGPSWADKLVRYRTLQKQADTNNVRNLGEIKVIDEHLSELRIERERAIRNVVSAQDQSHGILARIRALCQIAEKPENGMIVPAAISLVSMLIFLCEMSPMLGKLQVTTPAYDNALESTYQASGHHNMLNTRPLQFEKEAYNSILSEVAQSPEWRTAREELLRNFTSALQQNLQLRVNRFQGWR